MRKTLLTIISIVIYALSAGVPECGAQEAPYKFDIGAGIGMSGYLGDCNESNMFKHPGFAGQLSSRYIVNTRWAFRGIFSAASLKGNTADFTNILPGGAQYEFSSTVFDLGLRAEFNFFPYGIGETYKRLRRWSPYLTLGIGGTLASTGDDGLYGAFNIPMGAGVKYKVKERVNLGLEFSLTKVFGDNVDGDISDLYNIKSSFFKNTDWYSMITFTVTYEFGKRCETCNRID